MARGTYRERDDVRVLRQLVEFAEGEDQSDEALTEAGRSLVKLQASNGQDTKALGRLTPTQLRTLKNELRAFLRAAVRQASTPTLLRLELLPLLGQMKQVKGRRQRWLFAIAGPPRDVMFYQVTALVAMVGEDRLQFCPAPDCGRTFVKVGRRAYCSDRCQRRVFISTYDPFAAQPRRKDRQHGKTTRTR